MRVISGFLKGRKLKVPKTTLRPLTDRAKESLFNILQLKLDGARFLDLFAGSGSVGIEAISRGAKLSIFIERDRKAVQTIRENLEDFSILDRAEVFLIDAFRGIQILDRKQAIFDIIFLGAPYGSPDLKKCLELIGSSNILNEDGVLIAEHRHRSVIDDKIGTLEKYREERYGENVFSFYKKTGI